MSEKQIRVVSFVGGLVFFSIVVGVLLARNERIRSEVEEQTMSLLKTTKSAVSQIQFVVSKIGRFTNDSNNARRNSNIDDLTTTLEDKEYDELWSYVKA